MNVNGKTALSALQITKEVGVAERNKEISPQAAEAALMVLANAKGGSVKADELQIEAQVYSRLSRETRGIDDNKSLVYAKLALGASQVEVILRKAILDGTALRFMNNIRPGSHEEFADLFFGKV